MCWSNSRSACELLRLTRNWKNCESWSPAPNPPDHRAPCNQNTQFAPPKGSLVQPMSANFCWQYDPFVAPRFSAARDPKFFVNCKIFIDSIFNRMVYCATVLTYTYFSIHE